MPHPRNPLQREGQVLSYMGERVVESWWDVRCMQWGLLTEAGNRHTVTQAEVSDWHATDIVRSLPSVAYSQGLETLMRETELDIKRAGYRELGKYLVGHSTLRPGSSSLLRSPAAAPVKRHRGGRQVVLWGFGGWRTDCALRALDRASL